MTSGTQINVSHPAFVAAFEEDDYQCSVFRKTDTLEDVIRRCKENGESIESSKIWKVIDEICRWLLLNASANSGRICTSSINFMEDGFIFLNLSHSELGEQDVIALDAETQFAVYEAPELITRKDPDKQAFVWSLGCIVYEMLTLEPAFCNKDSDDPFAVYMRIMNGDLPTKLLSRDRDLADLVWACLQLEPDRRPTINNILSMSEDVNKADTTTEISR